MKIFIIYVALTHIVLPALIYWYALYYDIWDSRPWEDETYFKKTVKILIPFGLIALPFLIVFFIIYAIGQKIKQKGEERKRFDESN